MNAKVNVADAANLSLLGMPDALKRKIDRAVLLPSDEIPPEVVTMLSRVVVADLATAQRRELAVVYPDDVDPAAGRVSVLEALGTALFGASVGETIECETEEGRRRLRIEEMLYQPECWMRMHLVVRE